jgi:opacity protein-like surface antigen
MRGSPAGGTLEMKIWPMLSLCAVAAASPALADGFYVGVHGGGVFLPEADTGVTNSGQPTIDAELERDPGWLAGAAAGYAWHGGFALEGEVTYRESRLDKIALLGMELGLDGDEHSYAALANAYYRFDTGSSVTPYLGAGVGAAVLTLDAEAENGGAFDDSETVFAYQAMAGIDYALTPHLAFGLEYRYFATPDIELSDSQAGNTTDLETEYRAQPAGPADLSAPVRPGGCRRYRPLNSAFRFSAKALTPSFASSDFSARA